mmetsp:Transcript_97730/g.309908  ORF Transcript_97730/g.309908 Transcript_97730/m.309908 type:complete len:221 (+) Transcript_97730:248-910(+)
MSSWTSSCIPEAVPPKSKPEHVPEVWRQDRMRSGHASTHSRRQTRGCVGHRSLPPPQGEIYTPGLRGAALASGVAQDPQMSPSKARRLAATSGSSRKGPTASIRSWTPCRLPSKPYFGSTSAWTPSTSCWCFFLNSREESSRAPSHSRRRAWKSGADSRSRNSCCNPSRRSFTSGTSTASRSISTPTLLRSEVLVGPACSGCAHPPMCLRCPQRCGQSRS